VVQLDEQGEAKMQLDTLEVTIQEALHAFPKDLPVKTLSIAEEEWVLGRSALQDMVRMHLGHLPIATVVLPKSASEILTRPHEETIVRDFAHNLSNYFPNFFVAAIYELQSLFAMEEVNAYIIGGITRDMMLHGTRRYDIHDVDIIIEGQSIDVAQFVHQHSRNFDLIEAFPAFGTAKLDYKTKIDMDFASTREELYMGCGQLPEIVAVGVPLEVDIVRRDFTVNALAMSVNHPGQVIDCTGGLEDLEARLIRLLKTPSFFEDPSRILRALRFSMRMGFCWAEDTRLLLDQFLTWMPQVYKGGGDRIREELYRLFIYPESSQKVRWMEVLWEKGLFRLIDTRLPETTRLSVPLAKVSERLLALESALGEFWDEELRWQVYLTLLLLDLPDALVEGAMHRLGLTRAEMEVMEKSRRLYHENTLCPLEPEDPAFCLYEAFKGFPMGSVCVGLILSPSFNTCLEAYLRYLHELASVKVEVTGQDVLAMGVPQGEQVGLVLKELLQAKLERQVMHRRDELSWLREKLGLESIDSPPTFEGQDI